jgi:chromosome segregation ATPase
MSNIAELLRLQEALEEIEPDDEGAGEELDSIREKVEQCVTAWAACEAELRIANAKCSALTAECEMLRSAHEQSSALASGAHGHMQMYREAIQMKDAVIAKANEDYDAKCAECDAAHEGARGSQAQIESLQTMLAMEQAARQTADIRLSQALERVQRPGNATPLTLPPPPQYIVEFGPADGNGRVRSATVKPVKES